MSHVDFLDFTSPSQSASTSSVGAIPFGFNSKTNYDANESLIQIRSENFLRKPEIKEEDIWKRPPPDFRPQKFAPNPPKRNSRESQRPWLYGTIPGQREIVKRERPKVVPHLLKPKSQEDRGLVTMFHIDRPFTAKKKFVKEGMFYPGEFQNPAPHDFRGYPPLKTLGLPEFEQKTDKDPYNIKFHTDRLNIIHGARVDKATDREIKGLQMAPPKSPPPLHECHLLIDPGPWPVKNEQFTRHRQRHRPARSAFMERATRTLESEWAREKYEKALRESTDARDQQRLYHSMVTASKA
ncbi:hypothetical protein MAR_022445 [Mya arenaria]|uniref:Uncharacterized protein n=1 Tax=Mya arenaria TaxID=6604 RepID=A0ABY7DMW6_MYAAR|nr:uncharacterized protein LOC128226569 [Mya arenaria]XP_052792474.1 uncharacterized protein LOC128226569 [Mya arenaria]WAQ98072.1 hypothetical protein MAR_022445 [Mya arenaria]